MCLFISPSCKSCLLYINTFFGSTLGLSLPLGAFPPAAISSVTTLDPMLAASSFSSWANRIPPPPPSTHPLLAPSAPVFGPVATTSIPNSSCLGMILSPAADPIPYRLVQKFQSGEFIEMRELLADNIALHNQTIELHGHASLASTPAALHPQVREVPSLSSWMYCFAAYMAVRTRDPQTREMLAYSCLVIREALCHGGNGWQEYDRSFCWQAAIDSSLPWNSLSPGLQASTLIGNRSGMGTFCTICREPDHVGGQCALAILQQPACPPVSITNTPRTTAPNTRRSLRPPRRPETILGICALGIAANCAYPGSSTFKHVCAVCQLDHRGIECPDAPKGSEYYWLQSARRSSASTLGSRH